MSNLYRIGVEVLGAASASAAPSRPLPQQRSTAPAATQKTARPVVSSSSHSPPQLDRSRELSAASRNLAQAAIDAGNRAMAAGVRASRRRRIKPFSNSVMAAAQRAIDAGERLLTTRVKGDEDIDILQARNMQLFADAYAEAEPTVSALADAVESISSKTDDTSKALYDEGVRWVNTFNRVMGPEFKEWFAEVKSQAADVTNRIRATQSTPTDTPSSPGTSSPPSTDTTSDMFDSDTSTPDGWIDPFADVVRPPVTKASPKPIAAPFTPPREDESPAPTASSTSMMSGRTVGLLLVVVSAAGAGLYFLREGFRGKKR